MRNNSLQGGVLSRTSVIYSAIMIILVLLPAVLRAETLFLKDGSIVEGKIKSETDTQYQIVTADKKTITLKRSKVMRILNDNAYRVKKYIKKKDGKIVEGYIVEETSDEYTIREKIDSPAEFSIDKAEVVSMSTEKYITKTTYYLFGAVPGMAQIYADKNTEGLVCMGAFVVSCGLTGYAWYDFNEKKKAYDDLTLGTPQSTFDSKYDEYEIAGYVLMGSAILTAVVYIANWVDVIWFAAPDFDTSVKNADAGDVFYNVTLGDFGGINNTVPGMRCDAGAVYDYSLVKVSAGVRF